MKNAYPQAKVTSGRLLARHTVWNLLGTLLPMAVAMVSIPPLVRALGIARLACSHCLVLRDRMSL